jgi:hypothetical protein
MDISPACMAEHHNVSGVELLRLFVLMAAGWAWVGASPRIHRPVCAQTTFANHLGFNNKTVRAAWVIATIGMLPLVTVAGADGFQVANATCLIIFALRQNKNKSWQTVFLLGTNTLAVIWVNIAPWLFVVNVVIGWYHP